jgi:acyl-CoA synthetase (AMP-forming)/AMP-acid ligase II
VGPTVDRPDVPQEVPDGEAGELLVRGPNVMLGYYGQPDMTAAAIDREGYLKTGDIVSRSPGGELVVQGRSKELIIRSGFNVYPPEIEAVLNSHPAVLNSAVVGRSIEGNEEIIAFVESTPGRPSNWPKAKRRRRLPCRPATSSSRSPSDTPILDRSSFVCDTTDADSWDFDPAILRQQRNNASQNVHRARHRRPGVASEVTDQPAGVSSTAITATVFR